MPLNIYREIKNALISDEVIKKAGELILKELKLTNAEVSIHLIGDKKMAKLNSQYRKIHHTTDVLSFATENDKDDLGDIFVSIPQIKKQAKENDINFQEEFFRMLTHGILHLAGFDHDIPKKEKVMLMKQENFLNKIINK